jgi:hypothetical protein
VKVKANKVLFYGQAGAVLYSFSPSYINLCSLQSNRNGTKNGHFYICVFQLADEIKETINKFEFLFQSLLLYKQ